MSRWTLTNVAWLCAYATMLTTIVVGLRSYRESALTTYGSQQAGAQWLKWREEAERMGHKGAVQRDPPASAEPPALVLMRDFFPACLGISLLLSSCLFLTTMVAVRGALRPASLPGEQDQTRESFPDVPPNNSP